MHFTYMALIGIAAILICCNTLPELSASLLTMAFVVVLVLALVRDTKAVSIEPKPFINLRW